MWGVGFGGVAGLLPGRGAEQGPRGRHQISLPIFIGCEAARACPGPFSFGRCANDAAGNRSISATKGIIGKRLTSVRPFAPDRKSVVSGKSVSVRVDLGGRRIIKKKNNNYVHRLN